MIDSCLCKHFCYRQVNENENYTIDKTKINWNIPLRLLFLRETTLHIALFPCVVNLSGAHKTCSKLIDRLLTPFPLMRSRKDFDLRKMVVETEDPRIIVVELNHTESLVVKIENNFYSNLALGVIQLETIPLFFVTCYKQHITNIQIKSD